MPPTPNYPGVYTQEIPSGVRTIAGVDTCVCAFIGRTQRGPLAGGQGEPAEVRSFAEFDRMFGAPDPALPLGEAVRDFFANGGRHAVIARLWHRSDPVPEETCADPAEDAGPALESDDYLGDADQCSGLHALRRTDLFNLLCIPPDSPGGDTAPTVYGAALSLCVERRAMLLVDPPAAWQDAGDIACNDAQAVADLGLDGGEARNAALYFPRLLPRASNPAASPSARVPCGAVAGVIARTDAARGVWKAPSGLEADLRDAGGLAVRLTDAEQGLLNPHAVNCLRSFPAGHVVWGARTLRGVDTMGDEYRYVPVRRLALHIEESLLRGIAWAVFEPNDEALWAQLRLNIGDFLQTLFRQGAFQGTRPRDAWFVKCGAETTTQSDRDQGICNILIGFAPLKPAEFVLIRIAQMAGTSQT